MRKVTSFVISIGNGREIECKKIENYYDATNQDSEGRELIATTVEYVTNDGRQLEPLQTGAFRIIDTGEIGMVKL